MHLPAFSGSGIIRCAPAGQTPTTLLGHGSSFVTDKSVSIAYNWWTRFEVKHQMSASQSTYQLSSGNLGRLPQTSVSAFKLLSFLLLVKIWVLNSLSHIHSLNSFKFCIIPSHSVVATPLRQQHTDIPVPLEPLSRMIHQVMSCQPRSSLQEITEMVTDELFIPPTDQTSIAVLDTCIYMLCYLTQTLSLTAHIMELSQTRFRVDPSRFTSIRLIAMIATIPVSTAECESGFSKMNVVCRSLRTRLTVPHMSSLIFVSLCSAVHLSTYGSH